ncbi:unnamed protein product [Closterium sp. NIES-65]|nr:unnamed protein product [Closterium sp. NIES-65]
MCATVSSCACATPFLKQVEWHINAVTLLLKPPPLPSFSLCSAPIPSLPPPPLPPFSPFLSPPSPRSPPFLPLTLFRFCKIRQAGSGKEMKSSVLQDPAGGQWKEMKSSAGSGKEMKAKGPKEKNACTHYRGPRCCIERAQEGGVTEERREGGEGVDAEKGGETVEKQQQEEREKGVENEADIDENNGSREEYYLLSPVEEDGDADEVLTVDDAFDSIGFGPYQLFLVCYTGLAWLADAMEMILLSFVGPAARCEFGLSAAEESLIASVVFLGVFLGSYVWGLVADAYGRRRGFMATALFTLFAGLLSAWSPTFLALLISHCLVGFGIGGASVLLSHSVFSSPLPSSLHHTVRGRPPSSLSSSLAALWGLASGGGVVAEHPLTIPPFLPPHHTTQCMVPNLPHSPRLALPRGVWHRGGIRGLFPLLRIPSLPLSGFLARVYRVLLDGK